MLKKTSKLPNLKQTKKGQKPEVGAFYKADLPDEMIDRMLDYDKPLTQQPKNVQAALAKLGDPYHRVHACAEEEARDIKDL